MRCPAHFVDAHAGLWSYVTSIQIRHLPMPFNITHMHFCSYRAPVTLLMLPNNVHHQDLWYNVLKSRRCRMHNSLMSICKSRCKCSSGCRWHVNGTQPGPSALPPLQTGDTAKLLQHYAAHSALSVHGRKC